MPARSNEFQKLVKLIQQSLAPIGAKVTESAILPPEGREIDVFIESQTGPYLMRIAVEAKDQKRKLDVTEIEKLIGKYRGSGRVLVEKVVVVARRGFTKGAIQRANDEDITLLTLKEAEQNDWVATTKAMVAKNSFPNLAEVTLEPALPEEIRDRAFTEGRVICHCQKCKGRDKGSPQQMVEGYLMGNVWFSSEWREKMAVKAKDEKDHKVAPQIELKKENCTLRLEGQEFPLNRIVAKTERFIPQSLPDFPTSEMELSVNLPPHIAQVELYPEPQVKNKRALLLEGRMICKRHKRDRGVLMEFANRVITTKVLPNKPDLMKDIYKLATEKKQNVCAKISWEVKNLELHFQEHIYPLEKLVIHIHSSVAQSTLAFTQYELSGDSLSYSNIQCGEADVDGRKLQMLLPEGLSSKRITLSLEPSKEHG